MSEKIKAKIIKALNVKPGNGETPESYTQRLLKKVAKLKNDEWDNLLDNPEQKWINEQITRGNNIKDAKEAGEEYTGEPIDWFTPPASEAQDEEEEPTGEPTSHEDVGAESDEADEASEDDETQGEEADVLQTSESSKKKASGSKSSKSTKKAKPAKKEAAPKAKKATAKKKSGEENRGRKAVFARDQKIKLLVKENPHRKGTERWKRWNKYRNGMSVEEALGAGFNLNNLRYSVADKHIDIH